MIAIIMLLALLPAGPDDIEALFRQARTAEQRRDFPAALAQYDKVLSLNPEIAEVWANKGLVLYELNRHREALQAFAKATELKPQLGNAQLFLGLERLRFDAAEKAIAPLTAALRLDSSSVRARYALAEAYDKMGQYDRAIEFYRAALERDPSQGEARYALALAYLNQSKAISKKLLDSRSPYGRILLGEYQAIAGLPETAEQTLLAARKAMPGSPEATAALRQFYAGRHEDDKARAVTLAASGDDEFAPAIAQWRQGAYEKALELFSRWQSGRAFYWRALTFRALAQQAMVDAVRAAPESFQAHLLAADLARSSADDATARKEYEKAAELEPGNPGVQLVLVDFLMTRDPAAALVAARRALEKSPAHAGLNVALGRLLLKQGTAGEAIAHFERALAGDAGSADAREGLAEAYAASGDIRRAISAMEQIVSRDPDGSWHYRLGTWYRINGRAAEAKAAFATTARIKAEKLMQQEAKFTAVVRSGASVTESK